MSKYEPEEYLPGPTVASDEDLTHAAGDIATTIFHPVGTCKMGSDDFAVVNNRLCLHGLSGVRIADASIMPTITSGNKFADYNDRRKSSGNDQAGCSCMNDYLYVDIDTASQDEIEAFDIASLGQGFYKNPYPVFLRSTTLLARA